jgi:beta-lactamase superfamily II metal-dependent hydrolase
MIRAIAVLLLLLFGADSTPARQPAAAPAAGDVMPPWAPGTLDIHQIVTGKGNSAFLRLPDGTSLLIDAGDAGSVEDADARPDGSRTPGQWIARYVRHMMADRELRLDYVLVTHFHPDHIGRIGGSEPKSPRGPYLLSGLTEVGDEVPIATLVDRGYDYLTPAPTDRMFANYRTFVDAQAKEHGMRHVTAQPGSADQIVGARAGAGASPFEIRIVSANDRVWTGQGSQTKVRFPDLASIATPEDRPTENMCSVTLRLKYGRFDYFTGGDQPGFPVPGAPDWHDVESDVARAIGPTDVHVVNHHGSIEEENLFWLRTLASRVMVLPAWSATHPSPDVLKRMLATRVYAKPRDIFVTLLRAPTKATIGARAAQVASDHGHVVVRVEPGGERYWVIVLDDTTESYRIRLVKGPYSSE